MPDTYTLRFQNFRSLREVEVNVAPLTVIYGPNGSGKSSLLYGLLTLKNFLTEPNRNLPSLFSYPSISLGGWHEVVHLHGAEDRLCLSICASNSQFPPAEFTLTLDQSGGESALAFPYPVRGVDGVWPQKLNMQIAIPYGANQQVEDAFHFVISPPAMGISEEQSPGEISGHFIWNGLTLSARFSFAGGWDMNIIDQVVARINEAANLPMELARLTGFVPLRRGFSKPFYGSTGFTPGLSNEDEVASLLASSDFRYQQYKVSRYIEKITNRRVQMRPEAGTSLFTIDSIPAGSGPAATIVNEGFGINQLLYMLIICLHPRFKIVAIEEPEIHLHPSMVRRLASVLAEIAYYEDRRLVVSTHSEAFVVAILSQIAAGAINVDDVSFILAENVDGETKLTRCEATPDGQIEGGLKPFMAELEDLAAFLGLSAQGA